MRDVLVVDDDFMVAEIHRRFVEQVDGFRAVGVARTGAEALSAARELQPQLILLDVYLPDMTGLEVLQRLRSGGDRVGVIMITAARELDTVSGALDGGAADYLIKPFEFDQLKAKLEAFAARADALESADGVDQSLIDSLFGGRGRTVSRRRCFPRVSARRPGAWCSMRSRRRRGVRGGMRRAGGNLAGQRAPLSRALPRHRCAGDPAAVRRRPARAALPRCELTPTRLCAAIATPMRVSISLTSTRSGSWRRRSSRSVVVPRRCDEFRCVHTVFVAGSHLASRAIPWRSCSVRTRPARSRRWSVRRGGGVGRGRGAGSAHRSTACDRSGRAAR